MSRKPSYEELEQRIEALEGEKSTILRGKLSTESSDETYRIILENISDTVLITDDQGRITYVCPNTRLIFGRSPEEVYDLGTVRKLMGGAVFEISDLKRKNEIKNIEWSIRDKSGNERHLLISVKSVNIKGGTVLYVMRDFTERKATDDALREKEERFRLFFENAGVYSYMISPEGVIQDVNKTALETLKYSREELVGKPITFLYAEESVQEAKRQFHAWKTTGSVRNAEMIIKTKNGDKKWVILNVDSLRDESDRIVHSTSVQMDITNLKETEAALRDHQQLLAESKQIMQAVLEHTHMMAVYLDPQFNFVWVNRAYAETCGHEPSFFPGKNHFDLYPHEENQAIFSRVLETGEPFIVAAKPFEFPDQPERGETFWDWSLIPVKNNNGKVKGLVFTLAEVTERIRAEQLLRDSESKFGALVDQAPAALFLHDAQGRIVEVNRTALDGYGYTRDQLLNMKAEDIDPDFSTRENGGAFWQKLKERKKLSFEARHRRKDGSIFPVNVTLSIIILAGEEHVFALAEDITERKRAEESLRKSQRRHHAVLQTAMDGYWLNDMQGRLLEVNESYCRMSGYSEQELRAMRISHLEAVETEMDIAAHLEKTVSQGGDRFDSRHCRKDGTTYDVEVSVQYLPIEGGLFVVFLRDITERKQTEDALLKNEERLRLALDGGNLGTWDWHVPSGAVTFNERWASMFGYALDEIEPHVRAWETLLHPKDVPHVMEILNAHLDGKTDTYETEHRLRHKSGKWVWVLDKGRVIERDALGHAVRVCGTHLDITERKQAEEALKWNSRRDELLSNTASLLLKSENPRKLVEDICDRVMKFLGCDTFFNFLVDPDVGRLRLNACAGISADKAREIEWLDYGVTVCGRVARDCQRMIAEDIFNFPSPETELAKSFGIQAICCHPLIVRDRLIGTLAFGARSRPRFSVSDIEFMKTVADLVAMALNRFETEEWLRKSEEKYRGIFDASIAAIYLFDDQKRFLDSNRAGLDLLGYDRDELLNMSIPDVDADLVVVLPAHKQVLGGDRLTNYEHQLKRKDGAIITVLNNSIPITDAQGHVIGMQSTLLDITERKRAQEALKESEERFRAGFMGNPNASGICRLEDGVWIDINQAALDMFGYNREEVIGKSALVANFWVDLNERHKIVTMLEQDEEVRNQEVRFVHKDGRTIIASVSIRALTFKGVKHLLVITEDITDRKRAEEALLESEERFRAGFMGNPNAVAISRQEDGVWVDINQAALDMFGYAREEAIGTSALSVNLWVDPSERQRIVAMLDRGEEVRSQEVQLRRKDGRLIVSSVSVRQLTFKGEKHLLFTTEDVTERRLMEQERELNAARLEALLELNEKHRSDANELARFALEESARLTQSNIGFINLLSDDEQLVTHAVYTQNTLEHCRLPEDAPAFEISGCGLWSEAYRQKRPLVVNDYTSEHPAKTGLPGGHLELRRFMSIPVFEGDSVVAIAALGNKETEYNEGDVRQFRLFMEGLWGIMQRKKAESALELSEEKFSKAFRNAPMLMSINSIDDGRFLEVNDAFLRTTGYSRETVIGRNALDFGLYTTEDRNRILEVLNAEGRVVELELELKAADGTGIICLCSGEVVEFEGKKRLLCIASDITERKRNLSVLRESSERFQKVFNSQLDAIFVLDANIPAIVVDSNEAATTIFGYEAEEIIGETIEKLHVAESYLRNFQSELASAIQSEGFLRKFEFSMKRKDGSVFPTEHTVQELKNDVGERTGWISIVRDLTERKQMEARLLQAQRIEAIGTIAGGIAHDFNNILFPILAMSEMLTEDLPVYSPEHESAKEIFKAARRGGDLVKQILTFSRKSEHKMVPIQMQRVLKETLKLCRSTIPSNIEIVPDIQRDSGLVKADPTQVHQVAMNLITNAYHAVETTSGTISVRLGETVLGIDDPEQSALDPGRYVLLTVSDTGHGIEPAILDKIFDPYFTTKAKEKGTGLGLAVVYGIVKEHHGEIKVSSELGKGTTFNVFFPLIHQSPEPVSAEKAKSDDTGYERILLVDDEVPIVRTQKKVLERLGYKVTTASSSTEALETFRANPDAFDLAITDLAMPNMTGDRLTGELLSMRATVPIILCTGFSEGMSEKRAAEIGVKALLMKPIAKSDLARTVRKVLDEAKGLKDD